MVQDLIPYSCIADDCKTPFEMYLTADRLLAHMHERHSVQRWTCDHCTYEQEINDESTNYEQEINDESTNYGQEINDESTNFEPLQFDTEGEWKSHIEAMHSEMIPADQRSTFAKLNQHTMIQRLSCPLCQQCSVDASRMATRIDDHILQHLHAWALRALPEGSGGSGEKEDTSFQAVQPLSHTGMTNISLPSTWDYPTVTLEEIRGLIDDTWLLFPSKSTDSDMPIIWRPSRHSTVATEIWETMSRAFVEVLHTLSFMYQKSILSDHPELGKVAADENLAMEMVHDMNSVAFSDAQLFSIAGRYSSNLRDTRLTRRR